MKKKPKIYLWELAPSPHLGNVLVGMVRRGFSARYIVYSEDYEGRRSEGWIRPVLPGVEILHVTRCREIQEIIAQSNPEDVHICVGLRGNEFVRHVAASLRNARRKYWVFMETINERKWWSMMKRPLYRWMFAMNRPWLEGILAAGSSCPAWVAARGVPRSKIFDFAYFLKDNKDEPTVKNTTDENFRLLYIGSLIPRKRVHLIIGALKMLPDHAVLDVVGDGPLRNQLEEQARAVAPGRVIFHGTCPMPEVSSFMKSADCLVLPSDHDGWGAVISEGLVAGTRVVCSDRCGASVAVSSSNAGQVFDTFIEGACVVALREEVSRGRLSGAERAKIAHWAECLTETAGAAYLEAIIACVRDHAPTPAPPWSNI